MLILTRRQGENLIIDAGDRQIIVRVLNVNGKQVKIGVEAPRDVSVMREEIHNLKKGPDDATG